jgi:exosortase D (VPLPA-CTERM-specific)
MDNILDALKKRKQLLLISVVLVTFFFCYWHTLVSLFNIWKSNEDYSHGFLIPLITGFLLWRRKEKLSETPIKTNWWGGLFFFFFLLVSLYGILGSSPSAVQPAIPLVLLSLTLFCLGKEMLKKTAFPLSLLILMIPLPTIVQTMIGVPLKLISTKLAAVLLRIFDIPVFVEGNVIDLGFTQLQVADACSGLRYILSLLTVGVLFAYAFESSRWKRVFLGISIIPIAILTNGLRIGLTGILANRFGPEVAQGFFHGFSGWLIFVFAFACLFMLRFFLNLSFKKPPAEKILLQKSHPPLKSIESKIKLTPVIVASLSLLVAGILALTTAALPPLKLIYGMANFPLTFKGWEGKQENLDPEMIALSGAEEAFSGTYTNNSGDMVSLYIGYRGSPFVESGTFFHSPNVCLPSSGWKTLSRSRHEIKDVPYFGTITISKMLVEKMGERELVYFWFQTKNRTAYDVNINRFHLTMHALERDNTHDLFIRVIAPVKPDVTEKESEAKMDQFVRNVMAALLDYLKKNQVTGVSAMR